MSATLRRAAVLAFALAVSAAPLSASPAAALSPAQSPAQPLTYRRADLALVDTLGGAVTGVAFDEATSIAYVSRGARVEALDVASDPAGPLLLATSDRLAGVARVLAPQAGGRSSPCGTLRGRDDDGGADGPVDGRRAGSGRRARRRCRWSAASR
ncbi:MAG: hypothetical protein U0470_04200 [Anaerolineae bacterium]